MNLKKVALILAFIAVTAGVGYLLYRFFFAAAPPAVVTPPPVTGQPAGGGLPTAGQGVPTTPGGVTPPVGLPTASQVASGGPTQTTVVEQAPVLSPLITKSGNLNYYNQVDGKFYRQLTDGTVAAMSGKAFPDARSVEWSPQGDAAVIEFPDDTKVLYNFDTQKQVTLPKHWQDFSFSGDGKSIAAESIGIDESNRWLIDVASDGSNANLIEPLGENADKVTVAYSPNNTVMAFSDTADPVGFDTRDMLVIGRNHENYKAIRVEGFDFTPLWSPSGDHLIFSAAGSIDSFKPVLWFVDAKGDSIGDNRTDLHVNTWADKCTFADEATVYCAVPDDLPEGAGLQRDIAADTPDGIYKIDLRSGRTVKIGQPDEPTSIKQVLVSQDGSKLFFTDASGIMKSMRLK